MESVEKTNPTAPGVEKRRIRVTELDALRGLAAVVVVVSHYSWYCKEHFGKSYLPFRLEGHWAVLLFFVVSGFVISMTIDRCKSAMDFVVSRFARLYPPYWCAVAITFSLVYAFKLPDLEIKPWEAIANLSMIHNWFGVSNVDGVYWTLFAELSFYVWILLAFVTGALPRIRGIAVVVLALQVAYLFVERRFLQGKQPPEIWRLTFLVDFAQYFIAGIMFYRIAMRQHSWKEHAIILLCCGVAIAEPMLKLYTPGTPISQSLHGLNKLDLLVGIAIFPIFYVTVYGMLRWIVNPVTVFLGSISYSLYLVHENAGFVVIRELYARKWPLIAAQLTAGVLAIAVASILAAFVERPAQKWIKQQYKNWNARRAFTASYESRVAEGTLRSTEVPTP